MARRKDHTRDDIRKMVIKAARTIVVNEGVAALTARRIAAEIGYTVGTIYNIFDDMADIIFHVNGETLDHLHAILAQKIQSFDDKTPMENMKSLALTYIKFAADHPDDWALLFRSDVSARIAKPPWYQEKVDKLFDPLEIILTPYFTTESKSRRKKSARTIWGAVHGLQMLFFMNHLPECQSQTDLKNMIFLLLENFVTGLAYKAGINGI